jgi:nucleoside-diphosphate-sugar epimerase
VIHTGFVHDFSRFKEVCEIDKRVIETLGTALAGSDHHLGIASGTALLAPGRLATEEDVRSSDSTVPRVSEETAALAVAHGVRVASVRLPPTVHGDGDHGFVPMLVKLAREKGVSAYIGDGRNRWCAVHRLDAAKVFRLALENAPAGAKYHAVAEEGIPFRDIAQVIGKRLKIPVVSIPPEQAANHFGFLAHFAGLDCPASSKPTQDRLGWHPVQAGLISDLDHERYFKI